MRKVDVHVHCSPNRRGSGTGNARNPEARYIADAREVRAHLESQGIDHAVIMSGGETGGGEPAAVRNAECRDIVESQPDFYSWMCNLDPDEPSTFEDRLSRCKEQGAVGVGELSINEWMSSPLLSALFGAAERLAMPVTIHMSPEPGFSYGVCDRPGLPLLEGTLRRFPDLKILGHSQVFWIEISGASACCGNAERCAVGRGPVLSGGRIGRLLDAYPNLFCDLSAYSGSLAILRDEEYGLRFLEKYSERLLFATDTMNRLQTFPLSAFLDKSLQEARLSAQAWENICFRNARRLFGRDSPSKVGEPSS